MCRAKYPETERLRQVKGVGPITALAFVLTLQDPERFPKSRKVGGYVGLVPRLGDSSEHRSHLRITKAGDAYLRELLVTSAQYILGPRGPLCDLKRHGLKICPDSSNRNAKKRAAVAVARKLSVLLHHLWLSGEEYDPDYNLKADLAVTA